MVVGLLYFGISFIVSAVVTSFFTRRYYKNKMKG